MKTISEKEIDSYPLVALVGRTNVGKSTFFNRLIEEKKALSSPIAGTTRDINYGFCLWRGINLLIADTGGFVVKPRTIIEKSITAQAERTLSRAKVLVFIVDIHEAQNPDDRAYLQRIRKLSKAPLLFVANKADKPALVREAYSPEWLKFGLGVPLATSGASGLGVGDFLDAAVVKLGNEAKKLSETETPINVAIIGRTNVGKSSLVNKILGEDRVIVSPEAHTTREPQDTRLTYNGTPINLIDTVGIRKKTKIKSAIEREGVGRSIKSIEKADVVVLVLDSTVTPSKQESRLAYIAIEQGAGVLFVFNKWDLVEGKDVKSVLAYEKLARGYFSFVPWAPVLFVSALSGQRADRVLKTVLEIEKNRRREILQEELDAFIRKALVIQPPQWIMGKKKPVVFKFRQTDTRPPTFALVVKDRTSILYAYLRYLENRLRELYDFSGSPIAIHTEEYIAKRT